jgi:hypothetical protein
MPRPSVHQVRREDWHGMRLLDCNVSLINICVYTKAVRKLQDRCHEFTYASAGKLRKGSRGKQALLFVNKKKQKNFDLHLALATALPQLTRPEVF